MKIKTKNPGISLLIAFGISLLILGIALAVLLSVGKTVGQVANIERSNQIFFAAESGVEAALLHRSIRGDGVEFADEEQESQQLGHGSVFATTKWNLEGRSKPVMGVLAEYGRIEVPLYWDNAEEPTEDVEIHNMEGKDIEDIEIVFDTEQIEDEEFDFGIDSQGIGPGGEEEDRIIAENKIPEGGYLQTVLDWNISRIESGSLQTLMPFQLQGDNAACEADSMLICEDDLRGVGVGVLVSDGGELIFAADREDVFGLIQPCAKLSRTLAYSAEGCMISVKEFFENGTRHKITFQELAPFEDTEGRKLSGIPYEITAGAALPTTSYTVTSDVTMGDFKRTVTFQAGQSTGEGAFSYVVID